MFAAQPVEKTLPPALIEAAEKNAKKRKRHWRALAASAVSFVLVLVVSLYAGLVVFAPANNKGEEQGPQYVTTTTTVNVRSSDSEQADKLGKVAGGTKLQVLEQRANGWTKVDYEGKEGYIKTEFLQLAESAAGAETIGTVTATTNINVRASASETADRLGVLSGGDSAELVGTEGDWSKIRYNGQIGYVKSEYVQ